MNQSKCQYNKPNPFNEMKTLFSHYVMICDEFVKGGV
jgi:hypothetical protein